MRPHRTWRLLATISAATGLVVALEPSHSWAQTTVAGNSLTLRSTGSNVINQNGYVGTYVTLAAPGNVTLQVNAQSAAGGGATPHMNIAVNDSIAGFDVGTSATNYSTTVSLPAGTHFIRTELNNYAGRSLTVNNLTVTGATVSNTNSNTNALNAANTYINNYRKGAATVALSGPGNVALLPGTPVQADLGRHAFNFGSYVPGHSLANVNTYLADNPTPGTTAANFQNFINGRFNMLVPSNAGKWANNEGTRDVVNMSGADKVLTYAQSHNMRSRMHNLIWGDNSFNGQQPSWVLNNTNSGLLDQALNMSLTPAQRDAAKAELRAEITERIQSYANATRANQWSEVDVYNESIHTPAYWNAYGASGIAGIHTELAQAIAAAGSSAKVYTNEYNVFHWGDQFGNWYRSHIDEIRNAGGTVGGVGVQYYVESSSNANTNSPRSAARIMSVLQGLSVTGLPITLTEYGQQSGGTGTNAHSSDQNLHADIIEESLRMFFGNPQVNGFLHWGWWQGATDNLGGNSVLVDNAWNLTTVGQRWQSVMAQWDTNVATIVNPDGTISFTGFYGDYYLRNQAGGAYDMTLAKGTGNYNINLSAPATWSLWNPANSGNWSTGGNWTAGGSANAAGQTAYFGSAAAGRSVNVDGAKVVGMMVFDSANGYALGGAGTISLAGFDNASGNVARVHVLAGSHAITAPLALLDDTTFAIGPAGSTLTVAGLQPTSAAITKSGDGTLAVNNVRAASLSVTGGMMRVLPNGSAAGVSRLADLSVAAGSKLDLVDNKLIVSDPAGSWNGSAYTGVAGLVASGRNAGAWDGAGGIVTSDSRAISSGDFTSIAVAAASDVLGIDATATATYAGQTVLGSDAIAMFTYGGDANLDGKINIDDYGQIDFNVGSSGSVFGWFNGDFNYDGKINIDDYGIIDFNVSAQDLPFSTNALAVTTGAADAVAVPEPASGLLLSLAGGMLTTFRRRRNRSP